MCRPAAHVQAVADVRSKPVQLDEVPEVGWQLLTLTCVRCAATWTALRM